MVSSSAGGNFIPDTDVHIAYEEQEHINKFARLNSKTDGLKTKLAFTKNQIKNIEDGLSELELVDDDDLVPYALGETFIEKTTVQARKCMVEKKNSLETKVKEMEAEYLNLNEEMSSLKVLLYAKFGNKINLELDNDG